MRIAYIIYPHVIVSNRSNGIRSQAICWKQALEANGHKVDLINNWSDYNWKEYDVIHFFGRGEWTGAVAKGISLINPNIVYSPIEDPSPHYNYHKAWVQKFLCRITFDKYNSIINRLKQTYKPFRLVFARSNFELEHIQKIYDVPNSKLRLVPLSYSETCQPYNRVPKENFCLHISSITQDRKNVVNLIKAAKQYNFQLVLAGNKGTKEQFEPLRKEIGDARNIQVLGFIDEETKTNLYKKAKVFALPSKIEGVGIVALDAAYYGCEIAITNIPGPKEYYNGMCEICDPFSVDSIGSSILSLLDGKHQHQPHLQEFISANYSITKITSLLEEAYNEII